MTRTVGRSLCAMGLWLAASTPAAADVLRLSSGRELEGLVVRESPMNMEVQVAWKGFMMLDRRAVTAITRSDDADRARLLHQWEDEFSESQRQEQERQAFEASQAAKGLVRYRGAWINPNEMALIDAQHRLDEARQREAKLRREHEEEALRLADRISELEVEHRQLEQRLATATRRVVVVPSPLLIHQWHRHLNGPNVLRDEQGGGLACRRHDGHPVSSNWPRGIVAHGSD